MDKKKNGFVLLLLVLCLIVLAHNSYAHTYDCELLNELFNARQAKSLTTDVCGGDTHFDLFSDMLPFVQKHNEQPDAFISNLFLLSVPHQKIFFCSTPYRSLEVESVVSVSLSLRAPPVC